MSDFSDDLERFTQLPFLAGSTEEEATGKHTKLGSFSAAASAAAHLSRAGQRKVPDPVPIPDLVSTAEGPLGAQSGVSGEGDVDWQTVREIREEAASALSAQFEENPNLSDEDRERYAQRYVSDIIRTRVDGQITTGSRSAVWSRGVEGRVLKAVLDGLFRLGRLQPLLEIDEVENIHIHGFDDVTLSLADSTKRKYPYPVADSDGDLVKEINALASRTGSGSRSFTASTPRLHLDLPGNARMAAMAPPVSKRPTVVIRIHRLVDVSLDDLVDRDALTSAAAEFLRAAVRAGESVVTSGFPGTGKTTLVRALADCIPPDEKIVTIEMERELHLDQMGDRHQLVVSLEYQPGGGEELPNGRRVGEITLEELVMDTLRLDTLRLIVGEVRGSEIVAMMQAMQAGVGSLSTLHAASANDSIDRMSSLMLSKGANITPQYANRMIEQNVSLIVQVARVRDPRGGRPIRRITEIAEVLPGEASNEHRPVASILFQFNRRTQRLEPMTLPSSALSDELAEYGFDVTRVFGSN